MRYEKHWVLKWRPISLIGISTWVHKLVEHSVEHSFPILVQLVKQVIGVVGFLSNCRHCGERWRRNELKQQTKENRHMSKDTKSTQKKDSSCHFPALPFPCFDFSWEVRLHFTSRNSLINAVFFRLHFWRQFCKPLPISLYFRSRLTSSQVPTCNLLPLFLYFICLLTTCEVATCNPLHLFLYFKCLLTSSRVAIKHHLHVQYKREKHTHTHRRRRCRSDVALRAFVARYWHYCRRAQLNHVNAETTVTKDIESILLRGEKRCTWLLPLFWSRFVIETHTAGFHPEKVQYNANNPISA